MTSSEDSEEMHFIGNIILNKSPNQDNTKLYTKYRIIDGQQRVTTFCIFLLAIKSLLNLDFPADKREKDQIEEILKIFEENNGQLIEKTLRIELQESDELVFKEIVSAKDPNTRLIVMK
jgi:uncharacterized protein with ParB-like and HNH nuclease domain